MSPLRDGTQFVAFDGVRSVPSNALPCVIALLRALDISAIVSVRPSEMGEMVEQDAPSKCHVGALFTDLILTVTAKCDLTSMPYLMTRTWLEILIVFILKVSDAAL